ncbi:TetR/AcrR family transcriptional regulator C-terminal domain-containing protein [Cytobacillus sp. Hz8]|uniref:TetR/AcrR family transcriptional regulator C-terminal domain-containing protein n=1 Tax=Cytobacillus sp. Hz8 TaxID=3347168 RepID=UPI0035DAE31A
MTKKSVNKETITEAALEILEEKGLSHLTMRNVAKKLDVKAPALYWYIKNKQELLQLIAEHICNQIQLPQQKDNWVEEIILLSIEIRRILLAIPDGAEIMMDTLPITEKRLYLINGTLGIFHRAHFTDEQAFLATTLVDSYVTSFVLDEQKQQKMLREIGYEEVKKQFFEAITAIPKKAIPFVYHHMLSPKSKVNDEESFLKGLNMIIAGMKAQLNI